jgi:DNA repair exonuclease SbcCD ATPase subunit
VLRVEDGRSRPTLLSKAAIEKSGPDIRFDAAPSVPLIARDSFVAETAGKIEQLQATLRLMSRDLSQVAGKVANLESSSEQEQRWQTFQTSEKRSKEAKLEELVRGLRDLKARLDRIEARTGGDFHAYKSFEAVSRKLAELETLRDDAKRMERTLTLKAWLLTMAVGASALVIVLANALAR